MFRCFWETSFLIFAPWVHPSPTGSPLNSIQRRVLSQPSFFLAYWLWQVRESSHWLLDIDLDLFSDHAQYIINWLCTQGNISQPSSTSVSSILCLMAPTMVCTSIQLLSVQGFCGMNHNISELESAYSSIFLLIIDFGWYDIILGWINSDKTWWLRHRGAWCNLGRALVPASIFQEDDIPETFNKERNPSKNYRAEN